MNKVTKTAALRNCILYFKQSLLVSLICKLHLQINKKKKHKAPSLK